MTYKCKLCAYEYDEVVEKKPFSALPDSWTCPICGATKDFFEALGEEINLTQIEEVAADTYTASNALIDSLCGCGLKWVFGMVGHSNLSCADAVRRKVLKNELKFIGIRHEGAGAFAISAYGKLTKKPAACLTIAGPGATNLMTGLFDAKLDKAPAIALTGQVPSKMLGAHAFQELDLEKIFAPLASAQYTLLDTHNFTRLGKDIYENAVLKQGVVQITLPDDTQGLATAKSEVVKRVFPRGVLQKIKPEKSQVDLAVKIISESKKPLLLVGAGSYGYAEHIKVFAEKFNLPIISTYKARGIIEDAYEYSCGIVGRSGTPVSAHFVEESDCIISLAANFSIHTSIPKEKCAIQIDINPEALGRLHNIDCGICADLAEALLAITPSLEASNPEFADPRQKIEELKKSWKAEKERRSKESRVNAISAAQICTMLSNYIPDKTAISIDVGNVAYSFGRYFEAKNQRFLLSWYLGSIGVGLPAAMGAWCAYQEDDELKTLPIFAIVGDGGIGQYLAEWSTVVKYGMNIKCVVLNNNELAKISIEQKNAKKNVWETGLKNPDFSKFAELCGSAAVKISDPEKINESLAKALSIKGPVLIEVITTPLLT